MLPHVEGFGTPMRIEGREAVDSPSSAKAAW
jgi:hypothetical protein